jgi:divalent metal cation (Fe/Co/Zn/Cd) transporter
MRARTGIRVEYLSSAWMIVEVIGSLGAGLVAGSLALLAFGGDSVIELISGFAVLAFLQRDVKGSGGEVSEKAERVTSTLLFLLIPIIALGAVYSYLTGLRPETSTVGLAVAIGAVIVMPYLWFEKKKIGRETRSLPLTMDAIESVTCFFMSGALLIGLLIERFFGLWWADYVAATAILVFVAKEAFESRAEMRIEQEAGGHVHG